jgi:adenylate kinase
METEYGTPREYMEAGELVPDPVVNEIVSAAVADADGFILDGYPRNLEQVSYLEETTALDVVIYLEVGEEELIDRLTGRRVCEECGKNYHVEYDPPVESGVCDECGGPVVQRDDDTAETVQERIRVFEENTEPVIAYYEEEGSLVRIDGEQSPDGVWADMKEIIDPLD